MPQRSVNPGRVEPTKRASSVKPGMEHSSWEMRSNLIHVNSDHSTDFNYEKDSGRQSFSNFNRNTNHLWEGTWLKCRS